MGELIAIIKEETGKSIIEAYNKGCWQDNGKYAYITEENHIVGIHTTDEEIYVETFKNIKTCMEWLNGEVGLNSLIQKKGVWQRKGR